MIIMLPEISWSKSNLCFYRAMCIDKYLSSKKARNLCWSTFGTPLLCVQSFILIWVLAFPLTPLVCFLFWLLDADSVHICIFQIWTHFAHFQMPRSVELVVLAINLWTILICTFLAASSLSRLLFYLCVAAFWTQVGARATSKC